MSGREILFLAHRLPWPPDRGDRIRSSHVLSALAEIAPVHVIAPLDTAADRRHIAVVEEVAASVTTAVLSGSKRRAAIKALISGMPASVELFSVPGLHQAVRARLATGRVSTVFAFSGQMAHYVPRDLGGARFVMDFVDMDSAKFAEQGAKATGLAAFALCEEARRLQAFEVATARRADASVFVSEAEAALFAAKTGLAVQVIENGVDTKKFAPTAVAPIETRHPLIVFTGQMDYAPNAEAVIMFARDVMPLLPDAHFAIVGRAPTPAVRAMAGSRVIVTGEVPDTRPWLAAADVVVAPLLLARGVQNKVLEAMAMARPVVASSVAAKGFDARHGVELMVTDGREAQAKVIGDLLRDPAAAHALGQAARARVGERYSWASCLSPLRNLIPV